MNKVAFVFPGQGAQYIGMAADFINKDPSLAKILDDFDRENNCKLKKVMLEGPEELLKETRYTQPAILFHSIAALQSLLSEIKIDPYLVAGHSLGEFTALVANGVLKLKDALYLVHKRGEFMIKANQGNPFAMAAVIGLSSDQVSSICQKASDSGIVVPANFNTPVQTVISGSESGVMKALEIAEKEGAKRVVKLDVGGPFHSPMIKDAGNWLEQEMNNIDFSSTNIPVIANVSAQPVTDVTQIKQNLKAQVYSSVLWLDSANYMISKGIDLFIEFGPKKVLSGMFKKIDKNVTVLSIDKLDDVETVKSELKQL